MRKILISVLLVLFIFTGCKKFGFGGGSVFYPKYHNIAMKDERFKWIASLNWGDKLIDMKESITDDKEKKTYSKIKRDVDGKIGFVLTDYLIKEPMARAVILNPVLVWGTPSIKSKDKQPVTPPVLAYQLESKENAEGKWVKILSFNANKQYNIKEDAKDLKYEWIKLSDISTSSDDVEVIIAMQLSLKNYKEAKASGNPKKLEEVVATEKAALENVISTYKASAAVGFAQEALDIITGKSEGKTQDMNKPQELTESSISTTSGDSQSAQSSSRP